jgi:hypothetical protein
MRYRIPDDVIFHPVAGELVMLDTRSGEYLGLDEIGSELWRLLAAGRQTDEIKAELARRHGADPAIVGRDVDAFLAELQDADLIHPVP